MDERLSDDFAERWRQMEESGGVSYRPPWHRLPAGDFGFLRPDEAAFLRKCGLPGNAPYFSFEEVGRGMPRVDEVYGPRDEELWARIGRENVAPFRVLGSDGGGNPLAMHIESRDIWLLDHEVDFAPLGVVNSSLAALAESLLLFKRAESQAEWLEEEVNVVELQEQARATDPRGDFWVGCAEDLADLL